jgi:hypothetical protein
MVINRGSTPCSRKLPAFLTILPRLKRSFRILLYAQGKRRARIKNLRATVSRPLSIETVNETALVQPFDDAIVDEIRLPHGLGPGDLGHQVLKNGFHTYL